MENKKILTANSQFTFKGATLTTGDILILSAKSLPPRVKDIEVGFIEVNEKGELCVFDDFSLRHIWKHSGVFAPEDVTEFSVEGNWKKQIAYHASPYLGGPGSKVRMDGASFKAVTGELIAACRGRIAIASPEIEGGYDTVGEMFVNSAK